MPSTRCCRHSLGYSTETDLFSIVNNRYSDIYRMLIILLCAIVTSACTSSKTIGQVKPIVDMKGVNQEDYKIDLSQCQAYADEVEVGKQIVVGAASGTIIGAAAGAAARNSEAAKRTAGVGAVVGTAKGTKHAIKQSNQVLKRCLRGRGYRVLN